MNIKQHEKLLKLVLDRLEEVENEIILLRYDKKYLQMELSKLKEAKECLANEQD